MSDKEDYLTGYRVFFENFAATVNPEDQLPVNIAGYTITEAELPGEVLYWTTQYLTEKQCPLTLMTPLRRIILDEVRVASKKQPNEFGYRSEDGVYIALRLMQAVMARINDVCLRYLDNSKLDTLPPPPSQRDLKTVSIAAKNSRRVMEDRHVEIGNLEALFGIESTEHTSFYAVYDGHAGPAAATYAAAHLHQYLVESPLFTTDLMRATREAYLRTDAEFVRKSNQERACGGSTAVSIAIRGRQLMAAWAGDSQALLVKRMRLIQLVRPHKPNRQDERDRIEQSGGTVLFWGTWRVNGQLAVSRAIGDAQYKPYVTATPEITTIDLDGDEDFLVVACDGLWDFVSEDVVALAVYMQLAADPDDLKAVTKRLVLQAKNQHSTDNISIIVVFLKDPRDIVADNPPPMDLGLDNALANAPPPFVMETDVCKRLEVAPEGEAEPEGAASVEQGNGVDSDSDSDDLGPETAVDDDDMDGERNHRPAPPTPPAHTVETSHVDGGLVDNVAESGEESEDEWNYFKGEGEPPQDEADEPPRSETPCQDNSAWESSSVDMNSSPLNPDAPPFVPGAAGVDMLLAESPRKPLPMDDIELPDSAQFRTEAVDRPADLLDLDNCDQLNGHHNISMEGVKEHLNGNGKCDMDSLGFGFNVGIEPEKATDTELIQDFDRIQKDTTDFCNIQVFQAHTETNPFASEDNEELLERLKNKERDPMSMSFYQEKDDDTCERGQGERQVDLNAVQPLPDSDEEDIVIGDGEKENISPLTPTDVEPNNDILRFDDRTEITNNAFHGDNYMNFETNNMQNYSNEFEAEPEVMQTDTPESHKLLIEQIPEIPEGKSLELGFKNEEQDLLETENERVVTPLSELSQEVENKVEESPSEESQPEIVPEEVPTEDQIIVQSPEQASPEPVEQQLITDIDDIPEQTVQIETEAPVTTPDAPLVHENVVVDVHQPHDAHNDSGLDLDTSEVQTKEEVPEIQFDSQPVEAPVPASPSPAPSPLPQESSPSPLPQESSPSPLPQESPAPAQASPSPAPSPLPHDSPLPAQSPVPAEVPLPRESPIPVDSPVPVESPIPAEPELRPETASPAVPAEEVIVASSPVPVAEEALASSPVPQIDVRLEAPEQVPSEAPSPRAAPDLVPGEARAQEVCVPVTCELPPAPPAPAPPAHTQPALADTPIAADMAPAVPRAAAVAGAAVAAAAVTAAKAKTPASAPKKPATPASKTTPKPAPKAATPRTPLSAPTRPARTPPARTPTTASKPATPASAKPSPISRTTPAKAPAPARPAAKTTVPAATKPAAPKAPIARAAPKPAPAKEAPATKVSSARSAVPPRPALKAPAPRPASAPTKPATAPAKPASAASKPAAPLSRPAPRPAPARPKPLEKKPLPNGDVKDAKPPARPAARAAPAPARPAPRPTPRAAPPAPAAPKSAAPRALPRRAPADKAAKDLANKDQAKRVTKAAPPRTAPNKAPVASKVPPIRKPAPPSQAPTNGLPPALANGDALKPPASPPPADNALLPDVIA